MAYLAEIRQLDVPYHVDRPFTYRIPEVLIPALAPGDLVRIPFGKSNRRVLGLVTDIRQGECDGRTKDIFAALPKRYSLSGELLGLCLFLAEYTLSSVGEAVRTMLPPAALAEHPNIKTVSIYSPAAPAAALREVLDAGGKHRMRSEGQRAILSFFIENPREMSADALTSLGLPASSANLRALVARGALAVRVEEQLRNPYAVGAGEGDAAPIALSRTQNAAFRKIMSLPDDAPRAVLLHGVTGSGKTKVMMRLLDEVLAGGRTAIVMVPEIALTPQTVGLFCTRYGEGVAVIHSSLSAGERHDAWRRIRDGHVRLVIGTRSAVFAPLPDLGMIVIDEEHEHTYKSESDPKYHARDIAAYRVGQTKGLLLLASATPSLESYTKARAGKYTLVELHERYGGASLPEVELVDMREELRRGNTSPISDRLADAVNETISRGEQAILFLNRRGYNSTLQCKSCGEAVLCPHCSISLTYHASGTGGYLLCHACGYKTAPIRTCPSCGAEQVAYLGFGTQKVESEISAMFSGARIMRMDADTTGGKHAHDRLLEGFRRGEADILLGTQMVTKGHDFPRVTLVGVMLADSSLYVNDFRASERTFSLLTQVIGRAGRGARPGRALIQTYSPANEVLSLAARQDYPAFYASELAVRRAATFPPFCDMVTLLLTAGDEGKLGAAAVALREMTLLLAKTSYPDLPLTLFGPFEAQVYKVSEKYRMRMILKCRVSRRLRAYLHDLLMRFGGEREVTLSVDISPLSV